MRCCHNFFSKFREIFSSNYFKKSEKRSRFFRKSFGKNKKIPQKSLRIFEKFFEISQKNSRELFSVFLKNRGGFKGVPCEMAYIGKRNVCQYCLLSISNFAHFPENGAKIGAEIPLK